MIRGDLCYEIKRVVIRYRDKKKKKLYICVCVCVCELDETEVIVKSLGYHYFISARREFGINCKVFLSQRHE